MISAELKKVILKELNLDDFNLQDSTTANLVPGWDSLSHVRILCAIEEEFGIRFKSLEVLRLKNVGDLQALVDRKIKP
jgi:acyl carrier protein